MSGSNTYVCLDFTLDRLTALEVTNKKVTAWTVQMLPEGSLSGGNPVDPSALGATLGHRY